MNYKRVIHTLGTVLCLEGAIMLLPIVCALIYNEPEVIGFFQSMGICFGIGIAFLLIKPDNKNIYSKEGFVIVALSWIFMSIFGALPFVFS